MKTALLSFALLGTLALASCEKIKDAIFPSFEQDIPEVTVTVPIIATVGANANLGSIEFNYNVDSVIRKYTAQQFSIDNAKSVNVKSVLLNINNEDPLNNFSNFESVQLAVSSPAKPTPVVVAQTTVNSAASPLLVPGNNTDLKEYMKSSKVTYTLSGTTKKITTKPLQMSIRVQLKIN